MFFKGSQTISNLYDSHVHWLHSGQVQEGWSLKNTKDPNEILRMNFPSSQLRGNWITGFGWDENQWPADFKIHRRFLDQLSLDKPILLSRTDGHSSWVNTKALEMLGMLKSADLNVEVDSSGTATGLLRESAHMQALFSIPDFSDTQKKKFLLTAANEFNKKGFTHIREMTSNLVEWNLNFEILRDPDFLLHSEHWFVCESLDQLGKMISEISSAKKNENPWMKLRGVKVFVDGSLGSHTALISTPYKETHESGQLMWNEIQVKTLMREVWKNRLELALHTLGDEASHLIVKWAREVYSEGIQGLLHLEHVEILRPETIQNMKSIHVRCHLQPCHWWSDKNWLQNRLPDLYKYAFPWGSLRRAQIPISFGSDTPIEAMDLLSNLKALQDSGRNGIRKFTGNPLEFHVYPHGDAVQGKTEIFDDVIRSVSLGEKRKSFT